MTSNKILVGISGGVDSAVACSLLKQEGYAVSAAFFRFWDSGESSHRALADAQKICEKLAVPLEVIDARQDFQKTVIDYFLAEYAAGRTPNPCVLCNERMKFKKLLESADQKDIHWVATGHYARLRREFPISNLACRQAGFQFRKDKECKLAIAEDKDKDQSYFLYRLGQAELSRIIFPLGGYQKSAVRQLAKDLELPVFEKSDSQDVCFLADNDLRKFLQGKIDLSEGEIVDPDGRVIGRHKGLPLYTVGQRRGIEIGGDGPYFVVSKDVKKSRLIVTNDPDHPALVKKNIDLEDVVWTDDKPEFPLEVLVRTRYRQPLKRAIIKAQDDADSCVLEFSQGQKVIAPGQSAVFYTEDGEVLGGGIIS